MIKPKDKLLELINFFVLSDGLSLFFSFTVTAQSTPPEVSDAPTFQLNWFQAIVLGMVQGLTEFLPISSTAHLKVIPVALGWGDPGVSFTAVIQLGSIASLLWYFWSDFTEITGGMVKAIGTSNYKSHDFRLAAGIMLGTLPIIFFGLLWKLLVSDLDNSPLRSVGTIAIASIVMAILLAFSETLGTHKRDFGQLTLQDGILMGLAQALALIPGVSRSGSTMTAGLFMNLERATAARFSFLLGIPAITLAGFVEFKEVLVVGFSNEILFPVIIGVISSAIFSYSAITWLTRYLQNHDTWIFVWYRLGFGVLILGSLVLNLN